MAGGEMGSARVLAHGRVRSNWAETRTGAVRWRPCPARGCARLACEVVADASGQPVSRWLPVTERESWDTARRGVWAPQRGRGWCAVPGGRAGARGTAWRRSTSGRRAEAPTRRLGGECTTLLASTAERSRVPPFVWRLRCGFPGVYGAYRPSPGRARSGMRLDRHEVERRVVLEHPSFELSQDRRGFECQLGREHLPKPPVARQGLDLPPGPIQRQRELAAKPLPHRVLRDKRIELADQLGVVAARQVGVDPILDACNAQLLQPTRLDRREWRVEPRQRVSAPEREGVPQESGGLGRGSAASAARPCSRSRSKHTVSSALGAIFTA
jgi:hypothetical protein